MACQQPLAQNTLPGLSCLGPLEQGDVGMRPRFATGFGLLDLGLALPWGSRVGRRSGTSEKEETQTGASQGWKWGAVGSASVPPGSQAMALQIPIWGVTCRSPRKDVMGGVEAEN